MTQEANRSVELSYYDHTYDESATDVSFTVSEDAEDALFSAFQTEISTELDKGVVPEHKLHLLVRLDEQRSKHPPWIENESAPRTYDLSLTERDYRVFTQIVGGSLANVLTPDGADRYRELTEVWLDVTEQMRDSTDFETLQLQQYL